MLKKTAIKQLTKSFLKTNEITKAIEIGNLQESGSIISLDKKHQVKLTEPELSMLAKKKSRWKSKGKPVINNTLSLFEMPNKKI